MPYRRIGIVGCGNMGIAMLSAFVESKKVSNEHISVYDISEEKLTKVKDEYRVNVAASIRKLVKSSDILIIAVKPDAIDVVLDEIADEFDKNKILISIVAGRSIKYIKGFVKDDAKIVRLMPNTPALIGEGVIAMTTSGPISDEELEYVSDLLNTLGLVVKVDEKYMDAITGISGSSPAYVFMFIEALADAGVYAGLPRDMSYKIAAQAVMGSAALILKTGKHPGVLKDMVCSPAGTTIEAVRQLEMKGFRSAVIEAVISCVEKSKSL
ncbi:pyrroline-5-carboxylate reductase [Caldanaerobius polysaccharolyticus]|uniref:pyrroline-5-carboxylate reductase n=1 Tax=Caldanaerobius polysaccharolyticus TaxID=44256 RepID=UPI0005595B7C|nr:pyrroline-5-carboxylate reductase [Caldanaerobius polysaccharolyticus]